MSGIQQQAAWTEKTIMLEYPKTKVSYVKIFGVVNFGAVVGYSNWGHFK